MIKGIVGCKVMKERDLEPVLVKLKSHAAQYQGFQGVERLISARRTPPSSPWSAPGILLKTGNHGRARR